jgi:hypothetical protein
MKNGIDLITEERARHESLGYDKSHDQEHDQGKLALAAACYAAFAAKQCIFIDQTPHYDFTVHLTDPWPFFFNEDKRRYSKDGYWVFRSPSKLTKAARLELLAKAGALIAAEIDRLQS